MLHGFVFIGGIQSLAFAFSAAEARPDDAPGFDSSDYWRDSLQRAAFARALAAKVAPGSEGEAFTGALLQNMALPILLKKWGPRYLPVMTTATAI